MSVSAVAASYPIGASKDTCPCNGHRYFLSQPSIIHVDKLKLLLFAYERGQ
jgi:hypothetical protein